MIIKSLFREYSAEFEEKSLFLNRLVQDNRHFTVIDRTVFELYKESLLPLMREGRYYILEAKEENKNIATALEIVDSLVQLDTKKNTTLIAIGGGIVQDVTCFVASVLYRGINWFLVPTTLLAQTDSCIGSKSSINYENHKNLIGTFYPPTEIGIDISFVNTLSDKDYRSGLGEIIKIAIMHGKDYFYKFRKHIPDLLDRNSDVLKSSILKTLEFKKNVIEIDEFDRDYRNIMNYGHTFGHAFESVSLFDIPHGQGVMLGMLAANEISLRRGLITTAYKEDMQQSIIQLLSIELLRPEYLVSETVIPAMKKDKKFLGGGKHSCILVDEKEAHKYNDISNDEITDALNKVKGVLFCCETL